MKEAIVAAGPKVTIRRVDFPELPDPNHLIIKVIVSGSNPKDWAIAERIPNLNQGDDIAGVVHSVGSNVSDFKPGDRVASFHQMLTPHGSYGEYAIGVADTTFHIPEWVSFEEAATIPLAGMTAAVGLYQRLRLPLPWLPCEQRLPLVIYGAASAVGAFAIKLARLSNIHPLICVAGRGAAYVETLIDKAMGDIIVDYRNGDSSIVDGMREALGDRALMLAFDAVSDKGSYQNIMKVMDQSRGRIAFVLRRKKYEGVPDTVEKSFVQVGKVHSPDYPGIPGEKTPTGILDDRDFGSVMYRLFARGLAKGWFRGHPYEVVPGGLNGIETALQNLKAGKASAVKYVFRIGEPDDQEKTRL